MGRPQDRQRRLVKDNKDKDVEKLIDTINSQNEVIRKQQDIMKQMLEKMNGGYGVPERGFGIKIDNDRPQLDSYYINPADELSVKDTNTGTSKEETIVKDEKLNESANRLKELLKR